VVKRVRIRACAVWDTVSALGLPTPQLSPRPLSFVGKTVPGAVDHAFQAIALNESRRHFKPCVWEFKESRRTNVKQCWFLGSHGDVGGGNQDIGLAVLSFLWMIAQLNIIDSFDYNTLLGFLDEGYWQWEEKLNEDLRRHREKLKVELYASIQGR